MTRDSRLLAAALAVLMVTSVFGSIGAAAVTSDDGAERIASAPMGGDADPATAADGDEKGSNTANATTGDKSKESGDKGDSTGMATADLLATLDGLVSFLTDLRDRLAESDGNAAFVATLDGVIDSLGTVRDDLAAGNGVGSGDGTDGTDDGSAGDGGAGDDGASDGDAGDGDGDGVGDGGAGDGGSGEDGTTTETPDETTTETPGETTTDTPEETTTDTPTTETPTTETPTEPGEASVTFDDQTSSGRLVNVTEAVLPEDGEVRIVNAGGDVLGTTTLPAGRTTNVPVELDPPLTANQTLTAELFDAQGNALENASGEPAVDAAEVTVPVEGATRAPDLVAVSNFRNGTASDGRNATLVDFTFDQPVDLAGGPGNFNLVPIDNGGDPVALDGIGEPIAVNENTVTIAFRDDRTEPEGRVDESDVARGFVDANTVQPRNVSGISNPLQAEPVNNGGNSVNPDIVSVERNVANNSLVFTFDEAVNVSDTSGFNLYTSDGTESSNVVTATAGTPSGVSTTIEVTFGESTPVEEAVGGSVESNAVIGQDGPGSDTNLPDEELLTSSGNTNSMNGLTAAGFGVVGLAAASVLAIRRRRG